jgi:hypothetical protein
MFRELRGDFDSVGFGPQLDKVQQVWHSKRGNFAWVTMYPDLPPARELGMLVA